MNWSPITENELKIEINESIKKMNDNTLRFWNFLKIKPEKWFEKKYGVEGNGFWVVGLMGKYVIWYNDIEEGFNVSKYSKYGKIDEYFCNQDQLEITVRDLLKVIFEKINE